MFFATCHKSPERKFQPLREYFGSIRATLSLGRAPAAFGCSRRRSGVVGLTRLRQSAERSGSRRSRRHSSEGTAGTPGRTEACTHAPEERSFRAGEFRCRRPTDRPTDYLGATSPNTLFLKLEEFSAERRNFVAFNFKPAANF